ncbi:MAG: emopamil-binding family protein [Bacteroidia bacterium]
MLPKPLSERKYDWFFVIAFSLFIVTSIVTDSVNGLNGQLDPNSGYAVERFIYHNYAKYADPLLIANPPQVRVSAWISAFIWLPLYVYFVLGFVRGWENIRVPGLIYGGALTHGMITYMAEGMFGQVAREGWQQLPECVEPDLVRYFFTNIAYLIVPALMMVRMWKPKPFS